MNRITPSTIFFPLSTAHCSPGTSHFMLPRLSLSTDGRIVQGMPPFTLLGVSGSMLSRVSRGFTGFLMVILCLASRCESLCAQEGIFASSPDYSSPTIGLTSFTGTSQEAFLASNPITGLHYGGLLATDGNHLYWASYSGIQRTLLNTRQTESLVTFQPGERDVAGFTTDGHSLFLCDDNSNNILEYARGGQFIGIKATASSFVTSLITDGLHFYWSDEEDGLYRMNADGSGKQLILQAYGCFALSMDALHLYWQQSNMIMRCELDGSNPVVIVNMPAVFGISTINGAPTNYFTMGLTVTATHVYWGVIGGDQFKGIYRCKLDGSNGERLTSTNFGGESSVVAFPSALFPESMQPVQPSIARDASSEMVTLEWTSIPARRYQVYKSTDLSSFAPIAYPLDSNSTYTGLQINSPEPRAFFVVRKLPGIIGF